MNDRIEIQLSKKKITLLLVAGITFVIIGYFGALKPENYVSLIFSNKEIIRISGIAAICFFGIGSIFIIRKLFDNKPGLIIDKHGITDNSNMTSVGLVDWADIKRIEKKQVASTQFLIIHTNKPKKYLERAKNFLSKKSMLANQKMYGSPISITSNSLKINIEDLEILLNKEFETRKD